MTTIVEAIKNEEKWTIYGALISKRLFITIKNGRRYTLLTLTLLDVDGNTIELKSWNERKVYTVLRKVTQDKHYIATGVGKLESTSPQFSSCLYETRRWYIEELDHKLRFKRYLVCSSDIEQVRKNLSRKGRPQNVVANFVRLVKGPNKFLYGRPSVQGWYVKLCDQHGVEFYSLVWHVATNPRLRRFELETAKPGDIVLIMAGRPSYTDSSKHSQEDLYTLTTCETPVLNSKCISETKLRELAAAQ